MPLPIILGGIAAGIGSAVGGYLAYKGQKDTNKANKQLGREQMAFQAEEAETARIYNTEEAQKAREFNRTMSGTAYQRAMTDMKSAGLNPILAYSQGGASSPVSPSPNSPMGQGAMPVMQNPMAAGANVGTQIANSASNIASAQSQRDKISQEIENLSAQYELTWSQRQKVEQEARRIDEEIRNIEAQTEGRELENVQTKILTDFYDSANFARIAKDIGINPGTLKAIFTGLFGGKKRK